jgi:thiamine biosynthesis lipoprotein
LDSAIFAVLAIIPLIAEGCVSTFQNEPVLVKRAQMQMGTIVTLTVVASNEKQAQRALTAGFDEIHRLEMLLSTWIPNSELSQVNAEAGRQAVDVSADTLLILQRSLEIARLTNGGFNIAIGPAVQAWNISEDPRIPEQVELDRLRPLIDLRQIRIDVKAGSVFLAKSGMRVDVGGIGKGFAADKAAEAMQAAGAVGGVVALSGDIKTFGRMPDHTLFTIGIQHPRKEGVILARITLENEAISTAGDYERYFMRDGIRYHHILDPRTLQPARGCQSVTVIAKEGVMADGLDTGIFAMGPDRGMELIERLPDVEGVIVDSEGNVRISSGLKGRLRLEEPQAP